MRSIHKRRRTKNDRRTPRNQENGDVLRSKRHRSRPVLDQVDERAQRRKDQYKEENPAMRLARTAKKKKASFTYSWKMTIRHMAG